jgi:hypothetical protein
VAVLYKPCIEPDDEKNPNPFCQVFRAKTWQEWIANARAVIRILTDLLEQCKKAEKANQRRQK